MKKTWSGRFENKTDEAARSFHSSNGFDKRLYKHDITGSIAHAEMLGRQGIIPAADSEAIVKALNGILNDIESGKLKINAACEDIHSFVESKLISRIGKTGGRLHTGRSRNDQVALDMRMFVKQEIDAISGLLSALMEALVNTAKEHAGTIMPGYTHMQKAQPVTLGHHCLAYFEMFKRDYGRLADCKKRTDVMPLGSGALAGSTYPLDRDFVRKKLGFAEVSANSLDAVSDRDFCAEFIFCLSLVMTHLSRFCEELVLWSSDEFRFIEMSDAYSTGSSLMPQKKNPDMAELIRGKTGRVYGGLTALLTVLKGLPLSYNKDMQEDKEAVFDAVDTVEACLSVFCGMFASLKINAGDMRQSAAGGYTNATDAADWLVKKGVPFRKAHEITSGLVLYAIKKKRPLQALSLGELRAASKAFDESFYEAVSLDACVSGRALPGGTAETAVLNAIGEAEKFLFGIDKARG